MRLNQARLALSDDDWRKAGRLFLLETYEKRGKPWYLCSEFEQKYFFSNSFETPTHVNLAKLLHDIEQVRYLMQMDKLPSDFLVMTEAYTQVIQWLLSETPQLPIHTLVSIPESIQRILAPFWGRNLYIEPSLELSSLLNPQLDFERISYSYQHNLPGFSFIEQCLSQAALEAFYNHFLHSTLWHDFGRGGYVGSYLPDGCSSSLVLQLAHELRQAFPCIVGDLPLTLAWSYKYDSQFPGVGLHADSGGAVNFNIWLTPDEANLKPNQSGLILYDVIAPLDWHPDKYKLSDLVQGDCQMFRIPYEQNKALFFHSGLFHASDQFHFKKEYPFKRMNLTLLFGDQSGQ